VSEWVGWLATAAFASSYFFKDATALRRTQAVAATLWIAYGLMLGALPVVASNVIIAVLAISSAWRRPSTPPADAASG
jgi:hypothetical protein